MDKKYMAVIAVVAIVIIAVAAFMILNNNSNARDDDPNDPTTHITETDMDRTSLGALVFGNANGDYVIDEVCRFIGSQDFEELGLEYIEINLSVAQCIESNLSEKITHSMRKYGVRPEQVNLEITETADAATRQAVLTNMDVLIRKGMSFSLDDFGTGRSNLDYFITMPVNIIKFDYRFTHWYFENEKARDVIKGTVEIIKKIGLPIVAEGVETDEHLQAMRSLGVDYIQGFYFSKPIPEEEFVRFLKNHQSVT